MTLAVAATFKECAWLAADTLLSSNTSDQRSQEHALKIFKLSPNSIVAYAGDPTYAHKILSAAALNLINPSADEIVHFLITNTRDQYELEFLIVHDGQIHKLTNGIHSPRLSAAWIGDEDASKAFLDRFSASSRTPWCRDASDGHAAQITNLETICSADDEAIEFGFRLYDAMFETVSYSSLWRVRGPVVLANSGFGKADYVGFSRHSSLDHDLKVDGHWHDVDFAGADRGGYNFTTISGATSCKVSAWGMFHRQSRYGRIFVADLRNSKFAIVEGYAANAQHFCKAMEQQFLIELTHAGSI